MLEMIAAELKKTLSKKRFWIFGGLMGVLLPLGFLLIAYFGKVNAQGTIIDQQNSIQEVLNQIAGPNNMARNSIAVTFPAMLLFLVSTFSVFLIGEDRGLKMWKVILTSGRQRIEVLTARFISGMVIMGLILLATLLGSLVFGLLGGILGITTSGLAGDWGTILGLYGMQWLVLAAPLALGFLMAWLISAPMLSGVALIFLPGIVEIAVTTAITSLSIDRVSALNAVFQAERVRQTIETAQQYFLTRNLFLGPRLFGERLGQLFDGPGAFTNGVPDFSINWSSAWWSVGVSLGYTVLFLLILAALFLRRDVHD
jgi:ABC-type transport system involved in multi-copper enzyme maturation permease subunit